MVYFGLRRMIADEGRPQTLCAPGGKAPKIQPHLGCQLKAVCVGRWLWLHGLGHLSIEDRAVVMEMGKVVPVNDLDHAGVLSKFKDLVPGSHLNGAPHMASLSLPLCNKEVKLFAWISTPGSQGLPVHSDPGIRQMIEKGVSHKVIRPAAASTIPLSSASAVSALYAMFCPMLRLLRLHTLSPLQ